MGAWLEFLLLQRPAQACHCVPCLLNNSSEDGYSPSGETQRTHSPHNAGLIDSIGAETALIRTQCWSSGCMVNTTWPYMHKPDLCAQCCLKLYFIYFCIEPSLPYVSLFPPNWWFALQGCLAFEHLKYFKILIVLSLLWALVSWHDGAAEKGRNFCWSERASGWSVALLVGEGRIF